MRAICAHLYRAARSPNGSHVMDITYLALLAVLVGLTAAYLHLCARLEDRK